MKLDLATSTCTLSCNVLLHNCTRHTRTLPILRDLEVNRETSLRDQGSFNESVTWTKECALGERA
jgi:hypothetical protein